MTNRLISRTDRFRAASTGAGAVDWAAHHLTSDTRQARRLLFGADAWAEGAIDRVFHPQSLLRDLHRVTTPTLIFAGEDDERVHPSQSIMLYQALRQLGVETRLYLAPARAIPFRTCRTACSASMPSSTGMPGTRGPRPTTGSPCPSPETRKRGWRRRADRHGKRGVSDPAVVDGSDPRPYSPQRAQQPSATLVERAARRARSASKTGARQ